MKNIFRSLRKITKGYKSNKKIEKSEKSLPKYNDYKLLSLEASIGDLVAYDAGLWSKSNLEYIQLSEKQVYSTEEYNVFSGIKIGSSKNGLDNPNKYWRVLKIENDQVVLVSATSTERFSYIPPADNVLNYLTNIRNWDMYKNNYATKATILTRDLLIKWYYSHYRQINPHSTMVDDPLVCINDKYLLPSLTKECMLYDYNGICRKPTEDIYGIRIVIYLKPTVHTSGKNENGAWELTFLHSDMPHDKKCSLS